MAVTDCYSNFLRDAINDAVNGVAAFTAPGTLYVWAYTAMPTAAGGGTLAPGLSMETITNDGTTWTASSGQQANNSIALDFGSNSGATAVVVGIAFWDAQVSSLPSGNLYRFLELTTPVTVNNGQPFTMPINGITWDWHV